MDDDQNPRDPFLEDGPFIAVLLVLAVLIGVAVWQFLALSGLAGEDGRSP